MPLAPGPLILQAADQLPWQWGTYDFTQFTSDNLGDLDTIGAAIDQLILAMEAFDVSDIVDLVAGDLDTALATIVTWENSALDPNWDDMIAAVYDGDNLLQLAFDSAPAEAFIPPTGPFVPPTDSLVLAAPTIAPGLYTPSTYGSVGVGGTGGTSTSTTIVRSVSLVNTTTQNANNFQVGDTFTATITGNAGDDVSVHAAINGIDLGYTSYGQVDAAGGFKLVGTVQPSDVGAWVESWFVGGQFIQQYAFVVTP